MYYIMRYYIMRSDYYVMHKNVLHYADIKCITLCEKVITLCTSYYVMRKMYYGMRQLLHYASLLRYAA